MQVFHLNFIGEFLGGSKVGDLQKSIILHDIGDGMFGQFGSQPVMPVKIELKLKGTPGRNTQITQSELRVDKVEVIMQTFTAMI